MIILTSSFFIYLRAVGGGGNIATYKPIVRINGKNKQLPEGDKLTGVSIEEYQRNVSANIIDLSTGSVFTKIVEAPVTLSVIGAPPTAGVVTSFILELVNMNSTAVTYWSGIRWAGGEEPELTADGVDILGFYTYDGGTSWRGLVMAKDVQ